MNALLFTLSIGCSYSFQQAPFASVSFTDDGGTLSSSATINSYGQSHQEPLTAVAAASGEMVHAWLSEGTENAIELIVYDHDQPDGRSKMINHAMPAGADVMWGTCTGI